MWDERRNSSQTRPGTGTARECIEAFARLRASDPALCQWITDGYPTLTEEEHVQRFGHAYGKKKR